MKHKKTLNTKNMENLVVKKYNLGNAKNTKTHTHQLKKYLKKRKKYIKYKIFVLENKVLKKFKG